MITYSTREFTEDEESEKEVITSEDPQVILKAIEFLQKKLNK